MPGIARVGTDSAGGSILGGGQTFARVQGALWAVLGDAVAGHGEGTHAGPTLAQGSPFARINGIPACRAGHTASCGHAASGSASMRLSN